MSGGDLLSIRYSLRDSGLVLHEEIRRYVAGRKRGQTSGMVTAALDGVACLCPAA